ncbi:hypothetical protein LOD99_9818 [Oopsacas minuta]|uniref:DUF7587 domain-containing protein n=1 Tax=Oopsacas minuta TaxID=111878 RepID=A0AAV7KSV6_9METZ|nr:hypothetical protein LOD99_9818 [Oopsacas minuta]
MSLGLENFNFRYVYRVLRPNENPYQDLTCKDSTSIRSIAQHVQSGLRIPSQYISTTSSLAKAKNWLETADDKTSQKYKNKRTTIVKINISKIKSSYPEIANSAIDLTNDNNRNYFLENEVQKRFACAYQEVVFLKCIPSEVVTIEYVKDSYEGQEPLISRPPQYDSLQANMGIRNSSPVTNPRLQLKFDIDDEVDRYPPVIKNISSQNTYSPYSDRLSRQSTYPKTTNDNDAPSVITNCSEVWICLASILACVLPCSIVICCIGVIIGCVCICTK